MDLVRFFQAICPQQITADRPFLFRISGLTAHLLADKTKTPLSIKHDGKTGTAVIALPAKPLDPIDTVVVLQR